MVLGCGASCAKAKGLSDRPLETFGTKTYYERVN